MNLSIVQRAIVMNEALLDRFIELISTNTGLHVREQDKESLAKKIWMRLKLLKVSQPEEYYQILAANTEINDFSGQALREREWRELTHLLTTGESYFFRDKGQFNLLANVILPELIEAKNKQTNIGEKRSLRLWSAGCSTGEEPYSLAILLREMLVDWDDWNILILGTDINQKAVEKAKQGIYSPWSFRMVDPNLQMRYFRQRQSDWELDDKIRQMVTFKYGNLVQDIYPNLNSELHSMDLIICRNVFVYFQAKAISITLKKFYHTLRSGGYLMVGHTELYGQDLGHFQVKVLPESVVYQRSTHGRLESYGNVRYDAQTWKTTQSQIKQDYKQSVDSQFDGMKYSAKAQYVAPPSANSNQTIEIRKSNFPLPGVTQLPKPADNVDINFTNYGTRLTASKAEADLHKVVPNDILNQAETLFQNEAYAEAIKKAEQAIALHHQYKFDAYYLIAKAYANLGHHQQAIHYCHQANEIDSLSPLPYYILAHISEEKGEIDKAKLYFKRIIYLSPNSVSAYLELALIHKKEGNVARAKKMLATAVELLKKLPPTSPVEHQGEVRAGELLRLVQKMLKEQP